MSTGKLILLTITWVFASITIGVVVGVFLTEILLLTGLVDNGSREYTISLNVIAFTTFAMVVVVPLVFRRRFESGEPGDA
jgi:H+/Cl- antiporter ClcA